MPKRLTSEEFNELKSWLKDQQVTYKNLNRDFSDALPVANLLKSFYPKLIDLHNYPPRNSTQLKLNNWETFNYKVLSKLGLQQHKNMLDKLSKGMAGAIEALLYDIMLMIRTQKSKGDKPDEQEQLWTDNDDVMMVTVSKKIGDAIVQVPQKMILFSIYEQVLRESQAKDSFIATTQQKITHLENVLQLKEERIEELCGQLAKVSQTTTTSCPQCSCLPKRVKHVTPSWGAEESVCLIPEPPNLVPIVAKEN
ncbi:sperm flagellar protein 1 [Calliphora vicina]|uniref:sperm flagellar protein 1 n=1 Tax=Calliphora vicina TaxID=7373 RepID=UPI00325B7C25